MYENIILLQKAIKLVYFLQDTQADRTLHVRECCSPHKVWNYMTEGNGAKWASRHPVSAAKCRVSPGFLLIGKLLHDYHLAASSE
jgi:hypothetical protein